LLEGIVESSIVLKKRKEKEKKSYRELLPKREMCNFSLVCTQKIQDNGLVCSPAVCAEFVINLQVESFY
jgi:hypothetical protein